MIEYIKGIVISKNPTTAIIETSGIGYEISISLYTFNHLEEGAEAKLYIHEVIREDTHDLYGFTELHERLLFRLLVSVNGVGPNSARVMLSSYSPKELATKIADSNEEALRAVKGIGTKTAQRIIVDLRKKVMSEMSEVLGTSSPEETMTTSNNKEVCEEAIQAFITLGYPAVAARKVVAKLANSNPDMTIDDMIKMGLRMF